MINKELIKECLDILELKYTELDNGDLAVPFKDDSFFPHQIVTFISINDEGTFMLFSSRAFDYHPEGDLLMMANRHNTRCYAPCCFINDNGNVVFDRSFTVTKEVSPHYIINNIIRPSIFLPLDSFANFELTNEELEEKQNQD